MKPCRDRFSPRGALFATLSARALQRRRAGNGSVSNGSEAGIGEVCSRALSLVSRSQIDQTGRI